MDRAVSLVGGRPTWLSSTQEIWLWSSTQRDSVRLPRSRRFGGAVLEVVVVCAPPARQKWLSLEDGCPVESFMVLSGPLSSSTDAGYSFLVADE